MVAAKDRDAGRRANMEITENDDDDAEELMVAVKDRDTGRRAIMEITENDDDDAEELQDEDELSYNKKFPGELREEMIARVGSVTHLVRMRLVCKAWDAVITSPDLARLHAARRGQHEPPWLLVARSSYTRRPLLMNDINNTKKKPVLHLICDPCTTMQQWIAPSLPFLAAHSCDLSTCQSHGGLVCCLASTSKPPGHSRAGSNTVLIFNPITRAYKVLPSPPNCYAGFSWSTAAGRNVEAYDEEELPNNVDVALWRSSESRGGHFKVGVCDTATREVRVFDSRKGYWREGRRAPDRLKPRFQGFRDSRDKDTLYWYDVEVDTWFQTQLPAAAAAHYALKWPSIFKAPASSNLMLAAVLTELHGGAVAGFAVWAWGSADSGWVQMASTPADLVQGVRGVLHRLKDSKLMCHPNYVCMTNLLRLSLCPWKCFYPWILSLHHKHTCWKWSPQPLGPKTWANFLVISLLDPTLLCIP